MWSLDSKVNLRNESITFLIILDSQKIEINSGSNVGRVQLEIPILNGAIWYRK